MESRANISLEFTTTNSGNGVCDGGGVTENQSQTNVVCRGFFITTHGGKKKMGKSGCLCRLAEIGDTCHA